MYGLMKIGANMMAGMNPAVGGGLNHRLRVTNTTKDIGTIQNAGIDGTKVAGINKHKRY